MGGATSVSGNLSTTGNLGVGISSMNSVLHVQKDASTTWNTSGYSNPYNYQPHPHELAIINTQDNTTNSFAGIYFGAGETSSGSQINSARIAAIRTAAFTTDLAFATRGAAGAFAEKMRINSAGAVGIGTASPIPMTHIMANATTGTVPYPLLALELADGGADTNAGEGPAINSVSYTHLTLPTILLV